MLEPDKDRTGEGKMNVTQKETKLDVDTAGTSSKKPVRQRRSAVWRIAFWASVVGAVANLGGMGSLAAIGALDVNTVLTAALWVISAVFFATRLRWAPVIGVLMSLGIIVLLALQPYVVNSLANPKTDPNGGFSHFIGDMLIVSCVLLILVASIAALVQSTKQSSLPESRQTPRWFNLALGIIIGILVGGLFIGILEQPSTSGTTYTNGVPTVHMSVDGFNQSSVTISKGSKILFVDDVTSLHILAIGRWQNGAPSTAAEPGAPTLNNVQVNGGSVQVGPFTTAGTYYIYCTVHVGMDITIIVQ